MRKATQYPTCPYCNGRSEIRLLKEITGNKQAKGYAFVCRYYPACDSYIKMNEQTGKPLGTMANKQLRSLRIEAHRQLYRLYVDGSMSRDEAYEWMASVLNIPRQEAHIGLFQEYYCQKVIALAKAECSRRKQRGRR